MSLLCKLHNKFELKNFHLPEKIYSKISFYQSILISKTQAANTDFQLLFCFQSPNF